MSKLTANVTKVYKPEVLKCPYCGRKIKFRYVASNKIVQFSNGRFIRVKNMVYGCDYCNNDEVYPSLTATKLAFKGYTYSSKIICMIDYYKNLHLSREKISTLLEDKGIILSDRNVDIIYKKFQELYNMDKEGNIDRAYKDMMDKYGFINLSIDFITVCDTYYIIFYNFFTGEMLGIFKFTDLNGPELRGLLTKYINENYNIKVIITAGVRSKFRALLREIAPATVRLKSYVKF